MDSRRGAIAGIDARREILIAFSDRVWSLAETGLEEKESAAALQAALEAEKNGQKDEADEIISAPAYVPPVVLPKATPKVHGISSEAGDVSAVQERL